MLMHLAFSFASSFTPLLIEGSAAEAAFVVAGHFLGHSYFVVVCGKGKSAGLVVSVVAAAAAAAAVVAAAGAIAFA